MKRTVNIEVKLRDGESQEKLIKRFFKKCKKQEIIKEHLDKTSFFKSNAQKRKERAIRNKYIRDKEKKLMKFN